jgi:hypothetical protein
VTPTRQHHRARRAARDVPTATSPPRRSPPGRATPVILAYRFTPLADPAAVRRGQHAPRTSLGLRERILISPHGINVTLAAPRRPSRRT